MSVLPGLSRTTNLPPDALVAINAYEANQFGSNFPLLHFDFCMTYNSAYENTEHGPCMVQF